MKSFVELKKNLKREAELTEHYRLVVMGDCATQLLSQAIRGQGVEEGVRIELLDTDYDQIRAQVLDPASELYQWKADAVLLCMCTERLYEAYCDTPSADRNHFAETRYAEIEGIWEKLLNQNGGKILFCSFPEINEQIYGNYAGAVASSFLYQQRLLQLKIMEGIQTHAGVFLIDLCTLQSQIGREHFADPKLYYTAKMPFSMEVLPAIADQVLRVIQTLRGKIRKCVVLDLDNTLWGGVIGDDGIEGIEIGELGVGHAYQDFQRWLKELSMRGILLAVCSKNDEDNAKEPFLKHSEMILHLEDIAVFVANWEDKVSNIRKIRDILNIGMDSMVFFDDNPFERGLVRSMIPEICVPELPEDPALYVRELQKLDLFETASFSEEDAKRTQQYRSEAKRREASEQFENYDDYLKHLQMEAVVAPFDTFHYPRIAQLSQRSNQFNLRTIRYTEEDIIRIAADPSYITLYFTLQDCFGSHGLISAVIMKWQGKDLFIDTWIMSCRVLKRTMEAFIINQIVRRAKEAGAENVIGEYLPTPKNGMVKEIYSEMGFQKINENRFTLNIQQANPLPTYIKAV